ncbi:hypothetical protein WICMUC_005882 [Wickerhamomyces mucosus]|uniref:Uncharacterized protein n=1 Tax=Wickerhamomyces mucosus TaxID=1378264 RepID=A0A9P8P1R5_9ASCO|nr:hypothetical protein WICMUC_005882 [Wickerhamomyces mucosus]
MVDLDYYKYSISPKDTSFIIETEDFTTFFNQSRAKVSMNHCNFETINSKQLQRRAKQQQELFTKLSQYKFPSSDNSPSSSPSSTSFNSKLDSPVTPISSPKLEFNQAVAFDLSPGSPSSFRKPSRRFSHRRSIHTVSSTESIFSDNEMLESRYSSIHSSYRPRQLNFEPSTPSSPLSPMKHPTIDLDLISKPLRPRIKSNIPQSPISFKNFVISEECQSIQEVDDDNENYEINDDENDGNEYYDEKLSLLDFLNDGDHQNDTVTDEDFNPFKYIHLNHSMEFDPKTFRY